LPQATEINLPEWNQIMTSKGFTFNFYADFLEDFLDFQGSFKKKLLTNAILKPHQSNSIQEKNQPF
jgi:hypothetical protein